MLHCPLIYGCMDYEQYVLNNYSVPLTSLHVGDFIYFKTDGTYSIAEDVGYDETNQTINDLQAFGINYANRFEGGTISMFGYVEFTRNMLMCSTNRVEYICYGFQSTTGQLYGKKFVNGDSLDDLTSLDNYYHDAGYKAFSDWQDEGTYYGNYSLALTGQNGYAIFDYTNIKYNQNEDEFYVVRGENTTFYNYVNDLYWDNDNGNLYISYGAPQYSARQSAYDTGYGAGFSNGWVQGNDNGYQIGINQNTNVTQTQANAFDYVGQAFGSVGNIMSLEILPNITLGLAFSIPMVFVLIMTIFKLVRK